MESKDYTLGGSTVEKGEFLSGIRPIRDITFTLRIVRNSFAERSIIPFRPDIVIQPLINAELPYQEITGFNLDGNNARGIQRTPSPTVSSSSIDQPITLRRIQKSFKKLKPYLPSPGQPVSINPEKLRRRFERIERYTTIEYEKGVLKDTIIETFREVRTKKIHTRSKRQLSKTSVLTVRDAKRKIHERTAKENTRVMKRMRRANVKKWDNQPDQPNQPDLTPQASNSMQDAEDDILFVIDTVGDRSL
ncbi:transcriptional regulator family: Centromere protein B DNA-binding region [Penicillium canariense]|uniref:Transcriptional regulator family: Centromere protein B DNA-binding region n=1 Tax=Penicillium canariense TaxID=189055 RepID=A0A9W9IGE0_9EURO|nr:transcriptional regulator family: Centromere protein B DNA-binding region [Penicillium canariense]KAJ5176233.1 transcriptional regulator family: Centromere protein B DNA-binding region [Penicillium canariense]